ncbi:thioredoxin family protein [Thermofilum pendens]
MPREVLLFVCRDEASRSLINAFNSELSELPKPERPKLKVNLFKLKDPSNFKSYLDELERLYGDAYTREVKLYGVQALPAVVVDGVKVLEGRHPSREEIRRILGLPPAFAAYHASTAPPSESLPGLHSAFATRVFDEPEIAFEEGKAFPVYAGRRLELPAYALRELVEAARALDPETRRALTEAIGKLLA